MAENFEGFEKDGSDSIDDIINIVEKTHEDANPMYLITCPINKVIMSNIPEDIVLKMVTDKEIKNYIYYIDSENKFNILTEKILTKDAYFWAMNINHKEHKVISILVTNLSAVLTWMSKLPK